MSQLVNQLICFPSELIFNAKNEFQQQAIYYEKFNELYNLYVEKKLQLHSLHININIYQSDTCFLIENQQGIGLEDSLLRLKAKPKQLKKKLKTIGQFFYADGVFEQDKNIMIAALKLKRASLKEPSLKKYSHLKGFTFVHIFEKQTRKNRRFNLNELVNKYNNSSDNMNQQDQQSNQNIIQEKKEFINQEAQIDISDYISCLDDFKKQIQKNDLEMQEQQIKFEALIKLIK
ncbi:hypothetical protein TTHERM_000037428 (macronuclear) [Tetrahymena thermophila SB210]|uniref:Uncharacterized protein n=1 Tax=Tetrahymena thermophila (strain SB210) TaxID=312017 RepID=W7X699_TETTS|nr:hypothetical protein TTHERM_000037428 [Tetrahymena thermophila SB210]EWS74895.1 hypothetical protein TTHERM_000037428 [Tetrahymena thermophila SB210]|eukprot:XP_012652608.1 hypothetical protein TTHERM_000037428 [Tetrahymena thermophila SB210]